MTTLTASFISKELLTEGTPLTQTATSETDRCAAILHALCALPRDSV